MSQQHFQQQNPLINQSAGSINDFNILNFNINTQQEEFEVTKVIKQIQEIFLFIISNVVKKRKY